MMLLLLSLAALVLAGRGEKECKIEEDDFHWSDLKMMVDVIKDKEEPMDFHRQSLSLAYKATGKWDCTHYNKGKLTYSIKVRHNGTIKDVESIGCKFSPDKTIFYKVKGESTPTNYDGNTMFLFCGVPQDRACEKPFDEKRCNIFDKCPKFTPGSNKEAAKLECTGGKWTLGGRNYFTAEKATCKSVQRDANEILSNVFQIYGNDKVARFFLKLPSGQEFKLDSETRCHNDDPDATTKSPRTFVDPWSRDSDRDRSYRGSYDSDSGASSSQFVTVYLPILIASVFIIGIFVGIYYCCKQCNNRQTRYALPSQYPRNQTDHVPYPAVPYARQQMSPGPYPTTPYANQQMAPVPYPTVPYAGIDPTQRDTVAVEPAEASDKGCEETQKSEAAKE